jgi:hypothetical protein
MDITPQDNSTQPISDDQDLAKALAGVSLAEPAVSQDTNLDSIEATDTGSLPPVGSMQFENTDAAASPVPTLEGIAPATPTSTLPSPASLPGAGAAAAPAMPSLGGDASSLDSIKSQAITQLRPLMDKVELPAEEKFDTYLMLIRSTDDSSLIAPAHAAAQNITDEKRKAEALLDVIKEIDYLSKKSAQ